MNLLVLLTFLPVAGIPLLWLSKEARVQRMIAAGVSAVEMVLSIVLWLTFEKGHALGTSPLAVNLNWIHVGSFDIRFAMDVDGISVMLVLLTGLLGFIAAISAFGIQRNVRGFFAMYLLLLTGMVGTFVATDLF